MASVKGESDSDRAWSPADTTNAALATLAAVALRVAYLLALEFPTFDPWRHLQLVQNLRDGPGFTLFDGQPYIWYQPPWYLVCSLFPAAVGPEWIALIFSALCVPLTYVLLRGEDLAAGRFAALGGALLMAGYGPLIRYTCHFGPEAFGLFLMLAALVLARRRADALSPVASGLLFGTALVVRMNYLFNLFLFWPVVRQRRRALLIGVGSAVPLALAWWRNHRIIGEHAYLFTWDGLATPADGFNALSTLVIQTHPAVAEGLRRLHEQIVPGAEWLRSPGQLTVLLLATACLVAGRRPGPLLAFAGAAFYFLALDGSGSAHFFRIWVGLFPAMLIGVALAADRLTRITRRGGKAMATALLGLALLCGLADLIPPRFVSLEMVTPPPELLTEERYMVNSTFYHPESLVYRFPDKQFIGMPLDPDEFAAFSRQYPEYRSVLWHDFSVQDALMQHLTSVEGYAVTGTATNAHGRRYLVLSRPTAQP